MKMKAEIHDGINLDIRAKSVEVTAVFEAFMQYQHVQLSQTVSPHLPSTCSSCTHLSVLSEGRECLYFYVIRTWKVG